MVKYNFLWVHALLATSTFAYEVSTNTVLDGSVPTGEPVVVDSDAYLALIHGSTQTFSNDLTVNGGLYISDSNTADAGMTLTTNGNLENTGIIVVDNRNATTGMEATIGGSTFRNDGQMFFAGSYKGTSNAFNINPSTSLINTGTIQFSQDAIGSSEADLKSESITNDGTICLQNMKSIIQSDVNGNGCFDIGVNSMYVIQGKDTAIATNQTFYLSSTTSSLYSESNALTDNIIVRGFGNGNTLTFRTSVVSSSYDSETGILSVNLFPFIYHDYNIGLGYDSSLFQVKSVSNSITPDLINNGLAYLGPPPTSSRPAVCSVCQPIPWIPFPPLDIPAPYTTTIVSNTSTISEIVSFYSTQSDGIPVVGSTVSTIPPPITAPQPVTVTITQSGRTITTTYYPQSSQSSMASTSSASSPSSLSNGSKSSSSSSGSSSASSSSSSPSSSSTSNSNLHTTVTSIGTVPVTEVVSDSPSTDASGHVTTVESTYVLVGSSSELISAPYTTTIVSDGSSETDVVSYYPTTDSNGDVIVTVTTLTKSKSSTSTSNSNLHTTVTTIGTVPVTEVVSDSPSTDASGHVTTAESTYVLVGSSSELISAPYTTTIVSDGSSETDVVSYYPTTYSNGDVTVTVTTLTKYHNSSTIVTNKSTQHKTDDVISTIITTDSVVFTQIVTYCPLTDKSGHVATAESTFVLVGSSSVPIPKPSTTVLTKNTITETQVVSCYPATGESGNVIIKSTTQTLVPNSFSTIRAGSVTNTNVLTVYPTSDKASKIQIASAANSIVTNTPSITTSAKSTPSESPVHINPAQSLNSVSSGFAFNSGSTIRSTIPQYTDKPTSSAAIISSENGASSIISSNIVLTVLVSIFFTFVF
ncbi:uncharacterized protein NDAI_0I00800 [Naumovozyma dairenensis CBS 421]|uniref:Hyphally-regulated cell wall protein N-terminal domain-containing protein n=1 Tax=Naumovozyma dairenensis (strain ATCC 10597 / BCRC 20456 / CBS 421 / NBRC 0211 / NRRL Y-12639) TaxID=1071378 RepID=G0WFT8_NAUDC|nr:hypothetical protein NDAI_0I00800 [Naumovozyma dairenensis CBS 421]CCD26649.1 hypothetical protein NDAI_0I00800 [Naumovozyma dairenensis CBS 421]